MAEWWAPLAQLNQKYPRVKITRVLFGIRPIHIRHVIMARPYGTWCVKLSPPPPDWPRAGGLSAKVAAIHAAWYCRVMKWPRGQSLKPVFVPLPMHESDAHQVTAYRPKLTTIHVTRKCHVIQMAQRPKDEARGHRLGIQGFLSKGFCKQ
jgi:hypothetical protein